jgi:hypothetical protein
MTHVLPDADILVRKALAAGYTARGITATVWTLWPNDWYEHMPLVVARRVPSGPASDPRFLDAAIVSVTACASDRTAASRLARQTRAVLWDACTAQFGDEEAGGYLSRFFESSAPAEDRSPGPVLHTDAFRFTATYRLTTRPHPAA